MKPHDETAKRKKHYKARTFLCVLCGFAVRLSRNSKTKRRAGAMDDPEVVVAERVIHSEPPEGDPRTGRNTRFVVSDAHRQAFGIGVFQPYVVGSLVLRLDLQDQRIAAVKGGDGLIVSGAELHIGTNRVLILAFPDDGGVGHVLNH